MRKATLKTLVSLLVVLVFTNFAKADPVIGKKLFKERHCVLCHQIALTGEVFSPMCPGLKGVKKRHDRDWLRLWLKDPKKVWSENGPDVQDINRRYFKYRGSRPKARESFMATVVGTKFVLTDDEIEHLIDYLETL